MTPWEWFWTTYLVLGVITTTFAVIGHKKRFGYPLHWFMKLVGVVIWFPALLFGGEEE